VVADAAYARCLHLASEHYENFPVASRLLPASARPHVAAIYAFARIADRLPAYARRRHRSGSAMVFSALGSCSTTIASGCSVANWRMS
jgi:hypothetical protein